MAEGQNLRYAELTCTPYTSVRARHRDRGLHRGDRGRARRRRARLRAGPALDLRHPGGSPGIPAADATLEYALEHRTDALVGFGLGGPGDRGAARAVPAALRRAPAPPACTRCRTPARPPGRGRSGSRCACSAPSGSGTACSAAAGPRAARPPGGRPGSCWRSARPPTSPPVPSTGSRTTRCAPSSTRASRSRSTPTTRRCSPPPSTTTTRSPPACSTSTRRASPTSPARPYAASFAPDDVKVRVRGEIDAYAAQAGASS